MYWTGWPLMPPLSLTHLKYAAATLPIVVKSTPGISMSMPPILIGDPVAFLPVPLPQTLFVAEGVPDPTGPAAPDPLAAHAATNRPTRQLTARALPSFFDLIPSSLDGLVARVAADNG